MKALSRTEIKKRKIELKRQQLAIRGLDRIERIEGCMLESIKHRYENRISKVFDPVLSEKIDCLNFLIEA